MKMVEMFCFIYLRTFPAWTEFVWNHGNNNFYQQNKLLVKTIELVT